MQPRNNFFATVPFSSSVDAIVPINYSLIETWYESSNTDYSDQYLIADTRAQAKLLQGASEKLLEVQIVGKDRPTQSLLNKISQPTEWTTGYSGIGKQRGFSTAQNGKISVKSSNGRELGEWSLDQGKVRIPMSSLANERQLEILFEGDPSSSYLVNFKPSSTIINL